MALFLGCRAGILQVRLSVDQLMLSTRSTIFLGMNCPIFLGPAICLTIFERHLSKLTIKLSTCSSDTVVLIGISTPKQNLLGDMIGKRRICIHCIGAALLDAGTTRQETWGSFPDGVLSG